MKLRSTDRVLYSSIKSSVANEKCPTQSICSIEQTNQKNCSLRRVLWNAAPFKVPVRNVRWSGENVCGASVVVFAKMKALCVTYQFKTELQQYRREKRWHQRRLWWVQKWLWLWGGNLGVRKQYSDYEGMNVSCYRGAREKRTSRRQAPPTFCWICPGIGDVWMGRRWRSTVCRLFPGVFLQRAESNPASKTLLVLWPRARLLHSKFLQNCLTVRVTRSSGHWNQWKTYRTRMNCLPRYFKVLSPLSPWKLHILHNHGKLLLVISYRVFALAFSKKSENLSSLQNTEMAALHCKRTTISFWPNWTMPHACILQGRKAGP